MTVYSLSETATRCCDLTLIFLLDINHVKYVIPDPLFCLFALPSPPRTGQDAPRGQARPVTAVPSAPGTEPRAQTGLEQCLLKV